MPRHRGGGHSWDNLVAACSACNHRKGGKTGRGALAPRCRRSSRGTTPIRCSRRTCRTPATRPGARTCSWVGTDPGGGRGRTTRRRRHPRVRCTDVLRSLWSSGHAAYVVGGSIRDVPGRDATHSTGTLQRTPAPTGSRHCSRARSTRTQLRDGRRMRTTDQGELQIATFRQDHRLPPTSPATPPRRVRGHDRGRTSPAATSP